MTLGNGATYAGSSITGGTPSSPLVLSSAAALPGAPAVDAALCFPGTLDPATTTGKVVVCDRGVNARTDKGVEVRRAGGVGMVLVNTSPSSVNADLHVLPTVHLDDVAGAAVKAYAATAGATAAIAQSQTVIGAKAPEVAAFSSRGPSLASGDLLKPDVMAPGVDVLAAVAPPSGGGRSFDFYSGTSMSSPHVAGIAALYVQAHPDWSPMRVKSAMMTTAGTTDNTGATIAGGAFSYGAGHVRPTPGLDPGLVFDSGFEDWLGYLCGVELEAAYCADLEIDPSDLNTPSIAVGQLVGQQTVTRTLTNVSGSTQTFAASLQLPRGVRMKVVPSSFTIADGASQTVKVILSSRPDAALGAAAQGAITWRSTGGAYAVRSPVVVTPVALAVPATVTGTGVSGSTGFPVGAGSTGPLATEVDGLVPAQESTGQALRAGEDVTFTVEVPAGAELARFAMFDRDAPAGTDLDMVVRLGSTVVGSSGGGTTEELVDLRDPVPGTYTVVVDAFGLAPGQATVTPRVFSWALGDTAAGNLELDVPATVTSAQTYDATASWSGLNPTRRYLGEIEYRRGTDLLGTTLVRVDADA